MKKTWTVLVVLLLLLAGWMKWGGSEWGSGGSGGSEAEELSYSERVRRVAAEVMQPLTEQSIDRTEDLKALYEEGRAQFQQGDLSREEAARIDQVLRLLQELQRTRTSFQSEYQRMKQANFAVMQGNTTLSPEQKRRHFRDNQQRLWQVALDDARGLLDPALQGEW